MLGIPELVARSFVPTVPHAQRNVLAIENGRPVQFELAFDESRRPLWIRAVVAAVTLALLGGATLAAFRTNGPWRYLCGASGLTLLMMGLLYSTGGRNPYLYTQHLQPATTVLLAAWFTVPRLRRPAVYWACGCAAVALAIGDLWVITEVTEWMSLPVGEQPHNAR